MRRHVVIGAALAAIVAAPAAAQADGLPVGSIDAGPAGVTAAGLAARYVTLPAGRDTVVARIDRGGGQVVASQLLPGVFTIPAVALDGTPGGLSADGRTLVLIRPRPGFPQRRTQLRVLGTGALKVRGELTLRGDFSYDAITPDGERLYLIQYTSRFNPTHYRVRAYDLAAGRLVPGAIIDPREPDEKMRGYPLTRAASPDGRWAYTLYDGDGAHPFIHALDTANGTAACIDLDALAGRPDLGALRLSVGGETVTLRAPDGPVLVVDRASFAVREPETATRPAPARAADGGSDVPWTAVGVGAAAIALIAAAALAGLRRSPVQQ
jgi:hypothetical protein